MLAALDLSPLGGPGPRKNSSWFRRLHKNRQRGQVKGTPDMKKGQGKPMAAGSSVIKDPPIAWASEGGRKAGQYQ